MSRPNKPVRDLTGLIFSEWTVLSYSHLSKWLCRCSCGKTRLVDRASLVNKLSTKCRPCATSLTASLPAGEAAFNEAYAQYKNNAESRGLVWDLDKNTARFLFRLPCAYCGALPSMRKGRWNNNGTILCNGIDRIDSTKGYFSMNCVPCCTNCNRMKRDLTIDEFLCHANQITSANGRDLCQ